MGAGLPAAPTIPVVHNLNICCFSNGSEMLCHYCFDLLFLGHLGGSAIERLPLAQGVILGLPHRAPRVEPASPSACVSTSVCVCLS